MGEVIDFNKKRKESIEQKKRQFERIFFKELIGCYTAIDNGQKIIPVDIVDISKSGCLIELAKSSGGNKEFEIDAEVSIRLYFTKKSYIPLIAKVARVEETTNTRGVEVFHFGAEFDSNLPGHHVLEAFVDFVSKFAEFSRVDNESEKVYFF